MEPHVEEVKILGYSIVPAVLDNSAVAECRERIDGLHRRQIETGDGARQLANINDSNIVRCLLADDPFFLSLPTNERILSVVQLLLGDYFILQQQNGVLNPSDVENHQGAWHRDLPYQHFVSSRPVAVSALFCIDCFDEKTGGTFVLPCSHKIEAFPSERFVGAHEVGVIAEPGDVIVFDSMVFHRAGVNTSGRMRRGINHVFALPILRQQISIPRSLKGRWSDDPRLARLLGYDSDTPDNVQEWRERQQEKRQMMQGR
jgi:ectoine hydroxylase-related dioxygenase (phytanoyl-CoA dioxygenase family)